MLNHELIITPLIRTFINEIDNFFLFIAGWDERLSTRF